MFLVETGKSSLTISRKRGWSYGYVSAVDSHGRTIWIVDALRGDGKRFVVHADEILTAFLELEAGIRQERLDVWLISSKVFSYILPGLHNRR
jgi:hypothetical protein